MLVHENVTSNRRDGQGKTSWFQRAMHQEMKRSREHAAKELFDEALELCGDSYQRCFNYVVNKVRRQEINSLHPRYIYETRMMDLLRRHFAFAIPNRVALETIARQGDIIEIGAGTGYWAYLLRKDYGVTILAYDWKPTSTGKNQYHGKDAKPWTGVIKGRPVKAKKHPDRALMLCWPPYRRSMALDALKAYTGDTVIYIGEGAYGCTGDHAFHELLDEEWKQVEYVEIPNWYGTNDALTIHKRK